MCKKMSLSGFSLCSLPVPSKSEVYTSALKCFSIGSHLFFEKSNMRRNNDNKRGCWFAGVRQAQACVRWTKHIATSARPAGWRSACRRAWIKMVNVWDYIASPSWRVEANFFMPTFSCDSQLCRMSGSPAAQRRCVWTPSMWTMRRSTWPPRGSPPPPLRPHPLAPRAAPSSRGPTSPRPSPSAPPCPHNAASARRTITASWPASWRPRPAPSWSLRMVRSFFYSQIYFRQEGRVGENRIVLVYRISVAQGRCQGV